MIQERGQLTDRIKVRSLELLGYEIGVCELRLMPHFVWLMMDEQMINQQKITHEEAKIISKWQAAGHIDRGPFSIRVTHEFWTILTEIVFLGYVDIGDVLEAEPKRGDQ